MEASNFGCQQFVLHSLNHPIGLLIFFGLQHQHLQLLLGVDGFAIKPVDGLSVQQLTVHFVSVVADANNYRVGPHNHLYILCLCCLPIGLSYGVMDEVIAPIVFEADGWLFIGSRDEVHVALLVEQEAGGGDRIWGFVGIVRVSHCPNEGMLSWVEAFLLYFFHNFLWASRHFCARSCRA